MSRNSCNYETLKNFANRQDKCGFGCNNQLTTRDNPLYYCLNTGVDVMFDHAPMGYRYHPKCRECELYMTQYCTQKWDKYCDYYETLNPNIRNSVNLRLNMPVQQQAYSTQLFDPNNPFSPAVAVPKVRGRNFMVGPNYRVGGNC